MTEINERVTVNFDSESYYLDGEYWESWDNYGEEMADKINELLNELHEEKEICKQAYREIKEDAIRKTEENKELKQSNKDAWNLIQFIYNEIKEDGSMDWGRIQDLVEF